MGTSPTRRTSKEISSRPDPYKLVGGKLNGKYHLEEYIDVGGMGVIYRATASLPLATTSPEMAPQRKKKARKHTRQVAVKILKPELFMKADKGYLKLFQQEAENAQKLGHPNIVSVFDSGVTSDGYAFIVMEWLKGRTLEAEIDHVGKLPIERVVNILRQICDALDEAHKQRIVHLDIKPANIFLVENSTGEDFVKVIDFGLARLFHSTAGTVISRYIGTPHYSAPEVFANKASKQSDIYSLAVTTYEMLSGSQPFGQSHIYAMIHQHLTQPPPTLLRLRPDLPPEIDQVIHKALSKDTNVRHATAKDFYTEFSQFASSSGQLNIQTSTNSLKKTSEKARIYFSPKKLLLLFAFVLVITFIFFVFRNWQVNNKEASLQKTDAADKLTSTTNRSGQKRLLLFFLDTSGSMMARDSGNGSSKLYRATQLLLEILDAQKRETDYVIYPLSNKNNILYPIHKGTVNGTSSGRSEYLPSEMGLKNSLTSLRAEGGGTCILDSISFASLRLRTISDIDKYAPEIIFISDMLDNCKSSISDPRFKCNADLSACRSSIILVPERYEIEEIKKIEDKWRSIFTLCGTASGLFDFSVNRAPQRLLFDAREK